MHRAFVLQRNHWTLPGPRKEVCSQNNGLVPFRDKFLSSFFKLYHTNDGAFKNSLMMCLCRAYVAKAEGIRSPEYGAKVVNFMLALSATNQKAMDFVLANLCSLSICHVQRLRSTRRGKPFIFRSQSEITELVVESIGRIRKEFNDDSMGVAFNVGIDTAVLVKG